MNTISRILNRTGVLAIRGFALLGTAIFWFLQRADRPQVLLGIGALLLTLFLYPLLVTAWFFAWIIAALAYVISARNIARTMFFYGIVFLSTYLLIVYLRASFGFTS